MSTNTPAVPGKNGNGTLNGLLDKILGGLVVITLGLVGVVYAAADKKIGDIDKVQRAQAERITAAEKQNEAILRELQGVRSDLNRTNDKLDRVLERIK